MLRVTPRLLALLKFSDEGSFIQAAERVLHEAEAAFEQHGGEAELHDGVLSVDLEDGRSYVLNIQRPNQQVWWSSPLSGPKRFECWEQEVWVNTRDPSEEMMELLRSELNNKH